MRNEKDATGDRAGDASAEVLLGDALHEARHGSMERAWRLCLEAADLGRELADPHVIARASTVITGPDAVPAVHTASRQALCLEALALLGTSEPDMRELVEAQLEAITSAWAAPSGPVDQRVGAHDAHADTWRFRRNITGLWDPRAWATGWGLPANSSSWEWRPARPKSSHGVGCGNWTPCASSDSATSGTRR